MDFREALIRQDVTEQFAHASLQTENGLIRRRSQVQDPIVQSGVLVDTDFQRFRIVGFLRPRGVFNLQRKLSLRCRNQENLNNMQLQVLFRARFYLAFHLDNLGFDVDDAFPWNASGKFDHLLRNGAVVHGQHTLDGAALLAEHQEALLALGTGRVDSTSNPHKGVLCAGGQIVNHHEVSVGVLARALDHFGHTVQADRVVFALVAGRFLLALFGGSGRLVFSFLQLTSFD